MLAGADLIIAEACRKAGGQVLFIDDPGSEAAEKIGGRFTTTSAFGIEPEDLWILNIRPSFCLIVIAKPRTARDLFRVLASADRFLAEGGTILICSYSAPDGGGVENRFEATEIFLGSYPGYERRPLAAGVVELKKASVVSKPAFHTDKKRVISLAVFGTGGYWQYLGSYIRAHQDRKSTRLNSSHIQKSRMPSSA